jgi:hypothetical protein
MKDERIPREENSASITRHYDSLTDEELAEDRAWVQFAASQFPDESGEQSVGSNPGPANLNATPILDHHDSAIRDLAANLRREQQQDRQLLQAAHRSLVTLIKPVYSLDEFQPASRTLRAGSGSCSQRMACLEAVSRACGFPTRSRGPSGQRAILVSAVPTVSGVHAKGYLAGLATVFPRGKVD